MDEQTRKFIEAMRGIAAHWADKGKSPADIAEGAVFSVLVALDGGSGATDFTPYSVRPINARGKEGKDIGGALHELFFPKGRKEAANAH